MKRAFCVSSFCAALSILTAFEIGTGEETSLHPLFGGCVSGEAAFDSLISICVPYYASAAEIAREPCCFVDPEILLKIAWEMRCSFGASDRGWPLIPNLRLASSDFQSSIVSVFAFVRSESLQI